MIPDLPEVIESPGERFVFLVRSSQPRRPRYRVDLTAENGFGRCACRDWETRRWPAVKAGKPMGTRSTLCRHLILARRYFLNELLSALSMVENNS